MNTGFLGPAVATVPTVYGIETEYWCITWTSWWTSCNSTYRLRYWNLSPLGNVNHHCSVATVPTVYGIETYLGYEYSLLYPYQVATVPTVYGIETSLIYVAGNVWLLFSCNSTYRLRYWNYINTPDMHGNFNLVATVPTVYGIETW